MIDQVGKYLNERQDKLIGISELAEYLGQREGQVFVWLCQMEDVAVYKIYVCPKGHQLSQDLGRCPRCDRVVSEQEIHSLIFARILTR